MTPRPVRILHAPANVGGHPIGLSRAERELGLDSEVVLFEPDAFGFPADRCYHRRDLPPWRTVPTRLRFLAEAARRYDVFHFNFGSTLLPGWGLPVAVDELPLLRRLGKIVIATFQGDDARPPEAWTPPPPPELWPGLERRRSAGRRRLLRYAHRVLYLNPDQRRWLTGASFCPYASVDPRAIAPVPPRREGELTIVHAPSHRATKGTDAVIAAVEQLRADGARVRLDLVEGVRHDEALARLAAADIAVDQLLVGWYGGFAVEAMALGKPVLCHIVDEQPGDNPFGAELAIVRATPATLAQRLAELVGDPDARSAAGVAARRFVERHHDPRRVASRVLEGLVTLPDPG
ncbi:MAG TPA: glycosyltransferase [Solirubrobacteraceae bacterium]|nr:glycosyltransferase [Solirubrobacteraceae bacterium]